MLHKIIQYLSRFLCLLQQLLVVTEFQVVNRTKPLATSGNCFAPKLTFIPYAKIAIEFKQNFLKQDKAIFAHRNVVNLFIAYELDTWPRDLNTNFTLSDFSLGSAKFTKNADPNKYGCSGHGIGFDAHSELPLTIHELGENVVIFGAKNGSSRQSDNRKKLMLLLGEESADGLDDTTIMTQAKYSVNINKSRKKIFLSLQYNMANRFLHANDVKIYQFKEKGSQNKTISIVLGIYFEII